MHQQLFYQASAQQHLPLTFPLTNHLLNPLSLPLSYSLSQPFYSLENAYKDLLLRNQNMRALQLQNLLLQQDTGIKYPQYPLKLSAMQELDIFSPSNSLNLGFKDSGLPKELNYMKSSLIEPCVPKISHQKPEVVPKESKTAIGACLRKRLEKMIRSIMSCVNADNQAELAKGRELYINEPILLKIYDTLIMRYSTSKRCKEDIIRYILRKVFKILRVKIVAEHKVPNKKASFLLCQKYFHSRFNELQDAGITAEDEDGLLEFFMPYKKNSKNRTMNSSFIDDIFSSPEFCQEYKAFLATQFERFLIADNNRKIKKLVDLLVICIEKKDVSKLIKFSRLPWLGAWLQDAREYAQSLLPSKPAKSDRKVLKVGQ